MTMEEDGKAVEARVRTLNILNDALNKKDRLLLEPGVEYENIQGFEDCILLSTELVENIAATLQDTTLLKDDNPENGDAIADVYPGPNNIVVSLCQAFWKKEEFLGLSSWPGALILVAANIWKYCTSDTFWIENRILKYRLYPPAADDICAAFEVWMNHKGDYINGSYNCCGEKTRDSVCEESDMRFSFLPCMSKDQKNLVEKAKHTALNILIDALRKDLLLDRPVVSDVVQSVVGLPLITTKLVKELIRKLQDMTFKSDNRPRAKSMFAYIHPKSNNVIYLCPLFWKEKEYLDQGSRPGTLILYVANILGYRHRLTHSGAVEAEETKQCRQVDSLTADDICMAFEIYMNHSKEYSDGSYSCCGETARDSVCEKSIMRSCLKENKSLIEEY